MPKDRESSEAIVKDEATKRMRANSEEIRARVRKQSGTMYEDHAHKPIEILSPNIAKLIKIKQHKKGKIAESTAPIHISKKFNDLVDGLAIEMRMSPARVVELAITLLKLASKAKREKYTLAVIDTSDNIITHITGI